MVMRAQRRPPGAPPSRRRAASRRYAVLGLGNLIQGDEALGGRVVAMLQERPDALGRAADARRRRAHRRRHRGARARALPRRARRPRSSSTSSRRASSPGTVVDLDGASVMAHEPVMGVHDLGAEELLGALLFMDAVPRRVRVIGIQPAAITLGTELSAVVDAAVPDLVAAIAGHLAAWQAEDDATAAG